MNIKSGLKVESKSQRRIVQLQLVSKRALKRQELQTGRETGSLAGIGKPQVRKRNTFSQKRGLNMWFCRSGVQI